MQVASLKDEGNAFAWLGESLVRLGRKESGQGNLREGHRPGGEVRPRRDGRRPQARDLTVERVGLLGAPAG